jgi:hypothetical protein
MDLLSVKPLLFAASWVIAGWLLIRVWKSTDPLFLKIALTVVAAIPILGPLVVYWTSNFPNRLHPDAQAKHPKAVNAYGRWRTEEDERAHSDQPTSPKARRP